MIYAVVIIGVAILAALIFFGVKLVTGFTDLQNAATDNTAALAANTSAIKEAVAILTAPPVAGSNDAAIAALAATFAQNNSAFTDNNTALMSAVATYNSATASGTTPAGSTTVPNGGTVTLAEVPPLSTSATGA